MTDSAKVHRQRILTRFKESRVGSLLILTKRTLLDVRARILMVSHRRIRPLRSEAWDDKKEPRLVASLTTYPARAFAATHTVRSLLRQTMLPDKIVLAICFAQFEGFPRELESLIRLNELGVDVVDVPDMRSHKKYLYAFNKYPDDIVLVVDDDTIYSKNHLKKLYSSYLLHPNAVSACRVKEMTFNNERLNPHTKWVMDARHCLFPSLTLSAVGVGGVLYPPRVMPEMTCDENLIRKFSFGSDDIWLKIMSLSVGVPIVLASKGKFDEVTIPGTQIISQMQKNIGEGRYDKCLRGCLDALGWDESDLYQATHPGIGI